MHKFLHAVMVVGICFAVTSANAGDFWKHRVGVGAQYDMVTGDADSVYGGYVDYEFDLPEPFSVLVEVSYVTGDSSVQGAEGSFTSLGIIGALVAHFQFGDWEPYIGGGGGKHFNDFDNSDHGNKITMLWFGGVRYGITDRLSLDACLRYRSLQPDSNIPGEDPIDLGGVVVRGGVIYEL